MCTVIQHKTLFSCGCYNARMCLQNTLWIHGIQFYFAMEKGKGADIYLGYM